jgi:4-hydroxythreonine-4-phosphate dehydrogenase
MSKNLPLAVTMGDPAGVGPLITWQAWERLKTSSRPFFVIADDKIIEDARNLTGIDVPACLIEKPQDAERVFANQLPVLPLSCPQTKIGTPNPQAGPSIIKSIEDAVGFVSNGQACGVVTNPINKALLYDCGFSFPGHTEFLADLSHQHYGLNKIPLPVMMLIGGGLRVALATIHMALRDVPDAISRNLLRDVTHIIHHDLIHKFGIKSPNIALAGLNPHAGEGGSLGKEEIDTINPAAQSLRDEGLHVSDAQSGDTVFKAMLDGKYDTVIAMYHDQGLAPLKTLDMWGGVNVTLGLPFIRTSPDHGTGYDVAAQNTAKPDSLIAAINLAADMANHTKTA